MAMFCHLSCKCCSIVIFRLSLRTGDLSVFRKLGQTLNDAETAMFLCTNTIDYHNFYVLCNWFVCKKRILNAFLFVVFDFRVLDNDYARRRACEHISLRFIKIAAFVCYMVVSLVLRKKINSSYDAIQWRLTLHVEWYGFL